MTVTIFIDGKKDFQNLRKLVAYSDYTVPDILFTEEPRGFHTFMVTLDAKEFETLILHSAGKLG